MMMIGKTGDVLSGPTDALARLTAKEENLDLAAEHVLVCAFWDTWVCERAARGGGMGDGC